MGDRLTHGLISIFAVCTTQLRVCEELLVTTWNYTYRNLEIPLRYFYQKVEVLGTSSQRRSCRTILVSDHLS